VPLPAQPLPPLAVRNLLNEQLLDNVSGPVIIARVNKAAELKGAAAITLQNLSEWRAGGFADWLAGQEKVERVKQLSELAFRMAEKSGQGISAAAIAGGQVLSILEDFDVETQRALMMEKPENYLDLLGKIAALRKGEADSERARQTAEKLALDRQRLELERAKFERTTAELFLKFYNDRAARDIAADDGEKTVKIDKLRTLMFGEKLAALDVK
jgi:hypothetical protein